MTFVTAPFFVMKRTLLLLLLLLLLTGCAAPVPEATSAPAPSAEPGNTPSLLIPQGYTDEQSAAMSRYMSANRWLVDGKMMYGLDYDENYRPALVSCRLRGGKPGSFRILCEDCVPEYLALDDDCLYFLNGGALQRLTLKGQVLETLLEGPVRSLQLFEGALYYTDGEGRFCRAGLDGENCETLIEGPCDYAWAMPEGLLYQSESEGCCLRMRLWDGADRKLTAAASYAPLRIGNLIFYSQRDPEGSVLASVNLHDGAVKRYATAELRGAAELIPGGDDWRFRVFLAEDGWKQLLLRPGETEGEPCSYSGYRLCDYVGADCRVDAAYDPDGRLRCFVLVGAEGAEIRFFGGEILD